VRVRERTRGIATVIAVSMLATASASAAVGADGRDYQPLPANQRHEITGVPARVLARVGDGNKRHHRNTPPWRVKTAALRRHGKPEVAYVLGEWCRYCAGESWSVAVALSRFGTFRNLTTLDSGKLDKPAHLQTISFRYANYDSRYLHFTPIVYQDPHRKRVDKVPPRIRRVWKHGPGFQGFPWIDFGGKTLLDRASFDPRILAKQTRADIAADLSHPRRHVATAIDGTANQLTAAICVMTKDHPRKICAAKPIPKIERSLPRHSTR
jgi:hypothetical protein